MFAEISPVSRAVLRRIDGMPEYLYTAKNQAGTDISGTISANSKKEAVEAVHRLKLFPLTVEDDKKGEFAFPTISRRVPDTQIAAAMLQLADLLDNGVPVLQAFQILEKQTPNPRLKSALKNIHDRVAEGESIDTAFGMHSDIFSGLTVSVIRAGSEGAFLEDALRRVGNFLEQQAVLKSKVIGALIYPMLILGVGMLVIFILLLFVVPHFEYIFDFVNDEGTSLPLITQSLIVLREMLLSYGLYVCIAGFVFFYWLQIQLSTVWGMRIKDRLKMRLPLLGTLILESAIARFCRVLGTLMANGVPILQSLEISSLSTGNSILADAVQRSVQNVSSGETLAKPLAESGIFPLPVMAMISIAEESNSLETVLINLADSLESQTARRLEMLMRILGPALLLVMGLLILYIFIAMFMPMIGMWDVF